MRFLAVSAIVGLLPLLGGCSSSLVSCPEGGDVYVLQSSWSAEDSDCATAAGGEEVRYQVIDEGGSRAIWRLDTGADSGCVFVARGTLLEGDTLAYASPLYTTEHGEGEVTWELTGEGRLSEDGRIWAGDELIRVVESTDPAVEVGCIHRQELAGSRSN